MRRAYLDRARQLGDTDFVSVPVAELTSKEHARTIGASISTDKASSSVELGKDVVTPEASEPDETTHFSVMDRAGMTVTSTYTLEGGFGSHVVVKGAGFLLNNEMGDFNRKPGETNLSGDIGTPANLIDPGKRMLSSMAPTMVLKDGKVVLVTGSPGGRTITNTVLRRRARGDGVRAHGTRSGRCRAAPPSVAAGSRDDRGPSHEHGHQLRGEHVGARLR